MQHGLKIILLLCAFSTIQIASAQTGNRKLLLDSLNQAREKNRGVFSLYIKKPEFEIIAGAFRDRQGNTNGFEPINFTYHLYLPFEFDLNYLNLKAKDKLLKLNTVFIVHHSKYGNYAIGLGERFSFLLCKNLYLSYQIGVAWCEPVKQKTNDGINDMGFCLHHEFGLSYYITKRFKSSLNIIHISNANLFKNVNNNQDVIGVGLSYSLQ